MKTIIIGAQVGEHYYKPGMRVSFVVDGEGDGEGGVLEKIRSSGHHEEELKNDFLIQWDDCVRIAVTPQSMMLENVIPEIK